VSPHVAAGVKARAAKAEQGKLTVTAKKAAAKAKVLGVDQRTDNMPEEALTCRSRMHIWVEVPLTLATLETMVEIGVVTVTSRCANQCGGVWIEVFDPVTWERVDSKRVYERPEYNVPKGTGRMPKRNARRALMTRRFPSLFNK
jgi:hypothetical protein